MEEEYTTNEISLSLKDILPINPMNYDKHRAPKYMGQPTTVYFHVTVLSIDSINEESMVWFLLNYSTDEIVDNTGKNK